MIRQYIPYWEWEDWINGMWFCSMNEAEDLLKAIEFTGDHIKYGKAMGEVIKTWPRTMLNSLTNTSINRRAFLGHCAVMHAIQVPEYITRMAWKELTNDQREAADAVATYHINQYEKTHRELYQNLGEPVL